MKQVDINSFGKRVGGGGGRGSGGGGVILIVKRLVYRYDASTSISISHV